jgi:hypothetical protein
MIIESGEGWLTIDRVYTQVEREKANRWPKLRELRIQHLELPRPLLGGGDTMWVKGPKPCVSLVSGMPTIVLRGGVLRRFCYDIF